MLAQHDPDRFDRCWPATPHSGRGILRHRRDRHLPSIKEMPIGWTASWCSRLRGRTMIRRLESLCSHSILPASQMNKSLGLERFLQGLSPSAMVQALDREMVRRSLTEWCRRCGYVPAKHHRLIVNKLERVARGEIDRLALFMPPGSAKSTYAMRSNCFCPERCRRSKRLPIGWTASRCSRLRGRTMIRRLESTAVSILPLVSADR